MLGSALAAPLAGSLVARSSLRLCMVAGALAALLGFILLAIVPSQPVYFAACFVLLKVKPGAEEPEVLRRAGEREDEGEVDEQAPDVDEIDDAEVHAEVREVLRVAEDEGDDADHLQRRLRLALLSRGDDHALARGDAT